MPTVLLIDDEAMIRDVVRAHLEAVKFDVTEARDGREGVACYRKQRYDLVITDIIMPDQEGIATIRDIRAIDPEAKIIAMSGGGRRNNFEFLGYTEKLGAMASLEKPFTRQQLLETVARCLKA
ncbi:MAG: response regulator [Alphaproteobacteria bacterium]|nr:response regulator [Alphaproteobacteria bacterium]